MDRVEPNNVAQSYLLHRVKNTQGTVGGFGVRMPPPAASGYSALTAGQITDIESWVNAGAPP